MGCFLDDFVLLHKYTHVIHVYITYMFYLNSYPFFKTLFGNLWFHLTSLILLETFLFRFLTVCVLLEIMNLSFCPSWKWKWKWKWSRVRLSAIPWTVAYQVPPSMGFSRQEYWSGLPFPSPGDLPDPGIEPGSPTW